MDTTTTALTPDKQYAADIYNYIKNTLMVDLKPTDDQMSHAYPNIRLWLDSKGITTDGVSYMDTHKTDALSVATGPDYETVLASATPASFQGDDKSRVKLAAIAAIIFFAFWYLFKESSHGEIQTA